MNLKNIQFNKKLINVDYIFCVVMFDILKKFLYQNIITFI